VTPQNRKRPGQNAAEAKVADLRFPFSPPLQT
jgi:hypothetical protein